MALYKDRYRTESTRLKGWDYSANGYYFVTICTRNRESLLGDVVNGEMRLSRVGDVARKLWEDIPEHSENVGLDEFVIMPNHIHGIIVIEDLNSRDVACNVSTKQNVNGRDAACYVSIEEKAMSEMSPKSGSLGAIIRSYKSALTRWSRQNNHDLSWQSRFYDHIIRNEKSLNGIREYIINNPMKWELDKDNPANLYM